MLITLFVFIIGIVSGFWIQRNREAILTWIEKNIVTKYRK